MVFSKELPSGFEETWDYIGETCCLCDTKRFGDYTNRRNVFRANCANSGCSNLMKNEEYGKNYQYPHDFPAHFTLQQYMPDKLKGKKYYKEK